MYYSQAIIIKYYRDTDIPKNKLTKPCYPLMK